jgi:hypothetical protein
VLSSCARCGNGCGIYPFRVDHGLVGHELSVCHRCDALPNDEPTSLERFAMGLDPANPIDVLEFVEKFVADPARVRRSAAHFLGQSRYDELLPECREFIERGRARREEMRRTSFVPTLDDDPDADDDDDSDWDVDY